MNKPVYLGLSIFVLNKIVMYEFWEDYVKLKYGENAELCYKIMSFFFCNQSVVTTHCYIIKLLLKKAIMSSKVSRIIVF